MALGGGGAGVTASVGVGGSCGVQYTTEARVIFSGQSLEDSKVTWIWKADDLLKDGLEDLCEFRVTIPSVERGVKAVFKVTGQYQVRSRPARGRHPTRVDAQVEAAHDLELHFDAT